MVFVRFFSIALNSIGFYRVFIEFQRVLSALCRRRSGWSGWSGFTRNPMRSSVSASTAFSFLFFSNGIRWKGTPNVIGKAMIIFFFKLIFELIRRPLFVGFRLSPVSPARDSRNVYRVNVSSLNGGRYENGSHFCLFVVVVVVVFLGFNDQQPSKRKIPLRHFDDHSENWVKLGSIQW